MSISRRWFLGIVLLLLPVLPLGAESVNSLPAPAGYVNDFAGVLSDPVRARVEALCSAVDHQAHAQIAVVTIKTIDGDQSIEEFATQLEEKWKVGAKGTDRGVLMLLVMTPRRGRIEVGYGLEGILNDAKVGDIGRSMAPDARTGDYDSAVSLGVQQLSNIIAADAGVTISPIVRTRPRQNLQQHSSGLGPLAFFGIILVIILVSTIGRGGRGGGGGGLGWFVLGNLLGGGLGGGRGYGGGFGGGGGGGGNDGGGGFGGFGGGSSGGGGASGDF